MSFRSVLVTDTEAEAFKVICTVNLIQKLVSVMRRVETAVQALCLFNVAH